MQIQYLFVIETTVGREAAGEQRSHSRGARRLSGDAGCTCLAQVPRAGRRRNKTQEGSPAGFERLGVMISTPPALPAGKKASSPLAIVAQRKPERARL